MPVVNVGKYTYIYMYTTPIRFLRFDAGWLTGLTTYIPHPFIPNIKRRPTWFFFQQKLATCRYIRTFVSFFCKAEGYPATKVHFWWMISKKLKKGQRFVFFTKQLHQTHPPDCWKPSFNVLNVPISGSKFTFPVAVGHTVDGRNPAPGLNAWIRPW